MTHTIAVDAMSGDRGPEVAAIAIRNVLVANPDLHIIAVGDQPLLEKLLSGQERVSFEHTTEVISMEDNPLKVLRRRKSSMFRAIALVAEKKADAALSAGNTGALMGMSRIQLKMQQGFSHPAIASFVPCSRCQSSFCMLDLGANIGRSVEMLVNFAYMGHALVRAVSDIKKPRIALLNIGKENIKGGEELLKAHAKLSETKLNFIGNIEANMLFDGGADVVVCDGFTGNVFLKTMEGLSGMIKGMLNEAFMRNIATKTIGLISSPVLSDLRNTMDGRRYNGAAFLGLNGLVVKSHGNADQVAFSAALEFTLKQTRRDLISLVSSSANQG